jgi:FO synthase
MYGHIDNAENWSSHISLLREIQKETGGFTELVPLSFVYEDSPLYTQNKDNVRKGPTEEEVKKMHSVSRIMLHGFIDNIQVSWPKLGSKRAQELLNMGVNDLGGTLMNESISRAAGAKNGQEITAREISDIIRDANLTPARRNTLYEIKEVFENHNPIDIPPLVERNGFDPLSFLNT